MRLTTAVVTLISMTLLSQGALCQDDEIPAKKSSDASKATSMDDSTVEESPEPASDPAPADDAAPAANESASIGLDTENSEKTRAGEEEDGPIEGDKFLGVKATNSWHQRNGFGVSLALGSAMCTRDYCDSVLNVNLFGSITGTLGGFYRVNPNLVLVVDVMIGHLNTRMGAVLTDEPDKDNGTLFTANAGAEFHLPIVGWFDPYVGVAIGYAMLKAVAEFSSGDHEELWHGINIEPRLGANLFLWSTGFAKNLSLGAFMKVGFPVWPKMCWTANNIETCGAPSELEDPVAGDDIYSSTPFTLQMAVEARYHF